MRRVRVPVDAPKFTVVAAPPTFSVVAVVSASVNVVADVVMSPPLTARSPVMTSLPVTKEFCTYRSFQLTAAEPREYNWCTPPNIPLVFATSAVLDTELLLNVTLRDL